MGKKIPSFFCEFCGARVDKWAIQCDKCHRVFDSIKCPKCSYVGKAEDFPNGCPDCGFQSSSLNQLRDSIMTAQGMGDEEDGSGEHKGHDHSKSISRKVTSQKGGKSSSEGNLPGWAYLLIIGILTGVIGVMALVLLNILQAE